jgi:N-acetylneuraminate synthase
MTNFNIDKSNIKVVAEIGCNHKGSMDIAKEMIITLANFCNVDVVKFQKRNPRECLTEEEYNKPHPVPENSYGESYGEHREFLEFTLDQHKKLKKWCEEFGVEYSTSVWDMTSAKEIASLNPKLIKIPSAHSDNFKLIGFLLDNFDGDLHVSTGMTTKEEIEDIVDFFEKKNESERLVLYNCTSGYPVKFEDICLLEIKRLKKLYKDRLKKIGFSGHHLGISADIAAITLGAKYVERHFTLDRTWKGTDHAASLEPIGMMKLVRDIHNVSKALSYKSEDLLEVEREQRKKLKWDRPAKTKEK